MMQRMFSSSRLKSNKVSPDKKIVQLQDEEVEIKAKKSRGEKWTIFHTLFFLR